ncbi:MAG: hypothetical protein GX950_00815 [Candidatus Diapherotrites archaeon]|uniref:Uncharacterized protein n=1 Tax=Candidatus Iainarchaeum sp. TaxID=3101447 RepID=A0A7K4BYK8_9ARCH|nr:hypothetical protein [Candidatus Diapherotrites archaeon]
MSRRGTKPKPSIGQQLTFNFRKPLSERIAESKTKTIEKLKKRKRTIENMKRKMNERNAERKATLNKIKILQASAQKGLNKIRAIEIREAAKKGKYLPLPKFNPNNSKMKPKLIAFARKIDLERIKIIGAERFRQDWVTIDARRRTIANAQNKKARNFSTTSTAYVWDIYRIGQDMIASGNKMQQSLGTQLVAEVNNLFN